MKAFAPLALAAALMAGAAPVVAYAQVGSPQRIPPGAALAQVSVRYGAQLQGMVDRYGAREVSELLQVLQRQVELAAPKGGFTRADIVLEDARPNRPTFEQLGRVNGLSPQSLAVGGATITGTLYRADGSSRPLTFSWYETDIRQEFGPSTWTDAERAFDFLAHDLARGQVSARLGPGTPGPYYCKGGYDVFCR